MDKKSILKIINECLIPAIWQSTNERLQHILEMFENLEKRIKKLEKKKSK